MQTEKQKEYDRSRYQQNKEEVIKRSSERYAKNNVPMTSNKVSTVKEEIKKCVLLCANCHRLVHAKILTLDGGGIQ